LGNSECNNIFLIDVFSELAKMNDKAVLLCAGEGELQESIEAKVARLGIGDKVKFLGVRKDTTRLYQAMDVFVFPSLYEGLGIVGIEAQAAGLKMVCSDGIPDIARITDGVNALSLQKEPYEWAKKINSFSAGYNRVNTYSEIKNAGFDVKSLANDLQNYYLRRYGEVKERNK
jgi:glycosyltransferase involved in cell wall biosynthesis